MPQLHNRYCFAFIFQIKIRFTLHTLRQRKALPDEMSAEPFLWLSPVYVAARNAAKRGEKLREQLQRSSERQICKTAIMRKSTGQTPCAFLSIVPPKNPPERN